MDLISREEVRQARPVWRNDEVKYETEEATVKAREFSRGWNDCLHEYLKNINALPSAFEGMTNGEALKALFPNMKVHEYTEKVVLQGIGQDFQIWGDAWYVWWNSPYKGGE